MRVFKSLARTHVSRNSCVTKLEWKNCFLSPTFHRSSSVIHGLAKILIFYFITRERPRTLFGISNTIGNMNGFLAPQLAGYIIRDNEYTIDGWLNVWWTCLVLQIIGGSFYAAVASADRQPWADEQMTVKEQLKFELDQFLSRKDSNKEESTGTSN